MPAGNYVCLAGCGYDTINTGYFAIRKYLSIHSSAGPKFSAGHLGADESASRHIREADLLLILLKNN
ncbi:hypothetical protein EFK13_02755 [Bacillus cabrialesii]|uniref:hypothetical protein n=1 Tax=Bacillus cabrialesii TaxID=2487276 RepID=UPI0020104647|nr:hypothetical protein [Bacillus cabrialesii]UQE79580.1 hypothetical protein EFK13_02755 [Bacillus cabrialesii]